MREILFRGKEPETEQWYYGGLFPHRKTTYCFKEDYKADPGNEEPYIVFDEMTGWGLPNRAKCATVIPSTIGQYTGLKDRNGIRIFEGDIVCLCRGATFPMLVFYDGLGFKFRYSNGKLKDGCWDSDIMHDVCLCEVIGNIYDNPELLEVQDA